MKPVLFLDVDGTIIPMDHANADNHVTVDRTIIVPGKIKTVNGFTFQENDKTFDDETDIAWRSTVADFLKELETVTEIVWLTSWKHNVRSFEKALGLQEHEWLNFDVFSDESGKVTALQTFMATRPEGTKFMWVDDFSPVANEDKLDVLPSNGLIVTPDTDFALSDDQVVLMRTFLNQ